MSPDELHYERRVVSWIAHHCAKHPTLELLLAYNTTLKVPYKPEWIRRLFPLGCQARRNAELCNEIVQTIRRGTRPEATLEEAAAAELASRRRPCDLPGCKFPGQKETT